MRKITFYHQLMRSRDSGDLDALVETLEDQAAIQQYDKPEDTREHPLSPLVNEWIDTLSERDQELVYWIFGEGLTYQTCGTRRGVTKQAIHKRIRKLKQQLEEFLTSRGVTQELATLRGQNKSSSTENDSGEAPERASPDEPRNPRETR